MLLKYLERRRIAVLWRLSWPAILEQLLGTLVSYIDTVMVGVLGKVATAAILEMFRQTGPCVFGEDGLLKKGVIIRHLVLPGRLNEAKAVMDWVQEHFAPGEVLFSLMSQYTPWGRAKDDPLLGRRLRASEARNAREYMSNLGLEGFVQEDDSAKAEYIPPFDLTGV